MTPDDSDSAGIGLAITVIGLESWIRSRRHTISLKSIDTK